MGTHLHTCPLCEAMCGLESAAPPEFVDAISGNAAVNGIPVEVSAI
jgi:hypothetical protein